MSRWAAIIYGRTYEVDFRLLALPHDFNRTEQDWIMAHIQTMTRLSEELPNKPRWAVFTKDRLCVFGIVCMARELDKQANPNDEDITRDQRGRPLYGFVGYATRLASENVVEIPKYLHQDLSLFSRIYYQYVSVNWRVKSYDDRSRSPIYTNYQDSLPIVEIPAELDTREFNLNLAEDDVVYLWTDHDAERNYLWAAAAQQIHAGENVSLCMGLALRSNAINGPFLNATAADVTAPQKIIRIQEKTPVAVPESTADFHEPSLNRQASGNTNNKIIFILPQLIAVLFGAISGFLLARMLKLGNYQIAIYPIAGGVIAWILLLFAFAINLLIQRNSSAPARLDQNTRDSNVSFSHQNRTLGFRDKTEQDRTEDDDFRGWK